MPAEPRAFNEDELAQVEALASCLSTEQIADYFGISRTTFYEIRERQPAVSERYKVGKAKAIEEIAGSLVKNAKAGDTASAIFYLKTQAGWKETTVNEHTGKDGGPIETKAAREMTDDELLKIVGDDKS